VKKLILLIYFTLMVTLLGNDIELRFVRDQLFQGTDATLSLRIKNKDVKDYEIVGIEKFEQLSTSSGSSSSFSSSVINGKRVSQRTVIKSYELSLLPLEQGEFEIYAKVKLKDGSTVESDKIKVSVKGNDAKQVTNSPLKLDTKLSKEEYYFGEKIVLIQNLMLKGISISEFAFRPELKYSNFVMEDRTSRDWDQQKVSLKDGRTAISLNVYKGIIEAMSSGDYTLKAKPFYVNEITGRDFFGNIVRTRKELTPSKKIKIKPVPGYSGSGRFQNVIGEKPVIETKLDDRDLDSDGTLSLTVKVKGDTNLDSLTKIYPKGSSDFIIYESSKSVVDKIVKDKHYAEKEFDIVFIPKKKGTLKLPQIEIDYFDVKTGKYSKAIKEGQEVKIKKIPDSDTKEEIAEENQEAKTDEVKVVEKKPEPKQEEVTIKSKSKKKAAGKINKILLGFVILQSLLIGFFIVRSKKKKKKNSKKRRARTDKILKMKDTVEIYNYVDDILKNGKDISLKAYSLSEIKEKLGEDITALEKLESRKWNDEKLPKEEKLEIIALLDKIIVD